MRSFWIPRALQKGSLREPRPLPTTHTLGSHLSFELCCKFPSKRRTSHAPATPSSSCRDRSCCPVVRSAHLRQSFWSLVKLNSIEKISHHLSYSEFFDVFLFPLCSHGHELTCGGLLPLRHAHMYAHVSSRGGRVGAKGGPGGRALVPFLREMLLLREGREDPLQTHPAPSLPLHPGGPRGQESTGTPHVKTQLRIKEAIPESQQRWRATPRAGLHLGFSEALTFAAEKPDGGGAA